MPRNSRIRLVGKWERRDREVRSAELRELARTLWREWQLGVARPVDPQRLGRTYLGVDNSAEYCEMTEERLAAMRAVTP